MNRHAGASHILVRLNDARVPIRNLRIVTPDLDDVFFALTGTTQKESQA